MDKNFISQKIIPALKNDSATLLKDFGVNNLEKNEFVVFVKPEIFIDQSDDFICTSLEMIFGKFENFGIKISGVATIDGSTLEKNNVMSSHYGYINQMSNGVSKMIGDEDKKLMAEKLEINITELPPVLGGHEFLEKYPNWTPKKLDDFWFTKKSLKLRGGFYFQIYEIEGERLTLVNAFHPHQLSHYTLPERRIVLFTGSSEKNWQQLRDELIGDSFPEKSLPSSIRGELFANPSRYGQNVVNIGNNGIHMSAGPFEALKEMYNFYTLIFGIDLSINQPKIIKSLIEKGIALTEALDTKNNPIMKSGKDLFSETELLDTPQACDFYQNNIE